MFDIMSYAVGLGNGESGGGVTGIKNIKCGDIDFTTPVTTGRATITTVSEVGFTPSFFLLELQGDPLANGNTLVSSVMFTSSAFNGATEAVTKGLKSMAYTNTSATGFSYYTSLASPSNGDYYCLYIDSNGNIKQITQAGTSQLQGIYKWIAIEI